MNNDNLIYKMYFFVPYNISDIQKGIQAGHCVEQYAFKYNTPEYKNFVQNHKSWIVLNGGTTNNSKDINRRGSLDKIWDILQENNVNSIDFIEPDLNDARTAVCFLADQRVYDFDDYPLYETWLNQNYPTDYNHVPACKDEYLKLIGGHTNMILKELIYKKPLA